jgi:hypothetical protein
MRSSPKILRLLLPAGQDKVKTVKAEAKAVKMATVKGKIKARTAKIKAAMAALVKGTTAKVKTARITKTVKAEAKAVKLTIRMTTKSLCPEQAVVVRVPTVIVHHGKTMRRTDMAAAPTA